jgi:hypothetical protein
MALGILCMYYVNWLHQGWSGTPFCIKNQHCAPGYINFFLLICGSYMFLQPCAIFRELPSPCELHESLGSCVVYLKYNVQEKYVRRTLYFGCTTQLP